VEIKTTPYRLAGRHSAWIQARASKAASRAFLAQSAWLWLSLVLPATALAGPWEAKTAQGQTVRIVQDSYRTRDAYVLDRVYADGTADAVFGQQGSTLFTLGPDHEGPTALRLDSLGRPWVAGASAGRGDTPQAVVLRFLPQGQIDTGYAEGGRSATAPGGRSARALDLAPQADGSAHVLGLVQDAKGQERLVWWRLQADGRLDPNFGSGGQWQEPDPGGAELLDLATHADGSVVLRLSGRSSDQIQTWALPPGATVPRPLDATLSPASERPGSAAAGRAQAMPPAPPDSSAWAAHPFGPVASGPRPALPATPASTSPTFSGRAWAAAGLAASIACLALFWRRGRCARPRAKD
jgi:hypothetical protein